jgi:chemotaxis protein methyltransferase CheR
MNSDDYKFIRDHLKALSGIELGDDRQFLVETRLSSLVTTHGLRSIDDLVVKLRAEPSPFWNDQLLRALTTNETLFFRDKTPFEYLKDRILPALVKARAGTRIRIWSAACSTGQEPYSVAMTILEHFPELREGRVEIVATDLSTQALTKAKAGTYSDFEIQRGLEPGMRDKYFRKDGANWTIADSVKNLVVFRELNLVKPPYDCGIFDVIFCRNVIIYFDVQTKRLVLDGMHKALAHDGYLFLGGAETTLGITAQFGKVEGCEQAHVKRQG